jgi:hypothetical protein
VQPPQFSRDQNSRINDMFDRTQWREAELPIRSLYATQDSVNPDFSSTRSSQDLTPTVIKSGGNYYVRDGHHRLTRAAENGDQTANVAIIDLDNTDTSTPLLDYREPTQAQRAAARAENDALFADLFGDLSESDMAAMLSANASQSGGLLGAGLSEAQRQARDILDMRAAGRAGEVTDDMMGRADDQYMFNNTPLPMDEASRLARADAGGFDTGTPLFHGTPTGGFDAFDTDKGRWGVAGPGVYMGDSPNMAEGYLGPDAWNGIFAEDSQIYENRVAGPRKSVTAAELTEGSGNLRQNANAVAYGAVDEGFSGLDVPTRNGATISTTIDPSNIRSRFARFDPEFSHLSNLSAANASPTAGLLASGAQEQDKPLPFMEMLRGLLR